MGHDLVAEQHTALTTAATTVLERAKQCRTDIDYLGVAPLFADTRLYHGPTTDWVLALADNDPQAVGGLPVPRAQLRNLRKLVKAGLDFPVLYIAHEVPRAATAHAGLEPKTTPAIAPTRSGLVVKQATFTPIAPQTAAQLVAPPPPPARTTRTSKALGTLTHTTLRGIGTAAKGAGIAAAAVAAAPLALAALAASGLDPVLFGALPATPDPRPGDPAAYFVLAHWDWPS